MYSAFITLINKEFLSHHYFGPFSRTQLENIIGPFQTSPLSLVPKPHSDKYRLIQNLSYPHHNISQPSVNSYIDTSYYPCTFGTFLTICLIIKNLPPGSQVSTRDVADAYRQIPLHSSQWPGLVVKLNHDCYALNTQNSFGLASAGSVWGYVANFLADLFRAHGYGPLFKWVDNFIFFYPPLSYLPCLNSQRKQLQPTLHPVQTGARIYYTGTPQLDDIESQFDEDFIYPLTSHSDNFYSYNDQDLDKFSSSIGLPWKEDKSTLFSDQATYLGFIWCLNTRTVTLHPNKQAKYLANLKEWNNRYVHTLTQV